MNGHLRTADRSSRTTGASDGSRTITIHDVPTPEGGDGDAGAGSSQGPGTIDGVLRLRGARSQHEEQDRRRVVWTDDTIDNEGIGKKKSKICCIYHKPKAFDESSSEGSSSSGSDSDSDSDSDSNTSASDQDRPSMSRSMKEKRRKQHQQNDHEEHNGECDHNHEPSRQRRPKSKNKKTRPGNTMVITETETEENPQGHEPGSGDDRGRPNAYERGVA
ncbi:unnamed protein product [Sympodiomycopsis kandeliae]